MKICFGENLKNLRKERKLTQEEFASFLGVSFQTISKWERGETYPDLIMLTEIADFFNVSTDELLGADKNYKEKEIQAYIELFDEMQLKDVASVLAEFEKAVIEFSNEYSILVRYMELLHMEKGNVGVQDYKPFSEKLALAYEKIQKHCTDDAIRIRSKRIMLQHLMWQHQCLGWFDDEKRFDEKYKKQAEEIYNTLPSMSDSREYLSLFIDYENNYEESRRKTIEELSYLLQNALISYYYDEAYSAQFKIELIENINGILNITDVDKSPAKNRIHIIYNYGHLGHLYAESGDNENAIKYLQLAADEAIKFDLLPKEQQRAVLFYEQEKRFRNMSIRERMHELITKHYPLTDEFKATDEFNMITEKLNG